MCAYQSYFCLPGGGDQNLECQEHVQRLRCLVVQLFQDKPLRDVIEEQSTAQECTIYQLPQK